MKNIIVVTGRRALLGSNLIDLLLKKQSLKSFQLMIIVLDQKKSF